MSQRPLADALAALSHFMVADASLGDTLHRVAEITSDAIPAVSYVGISMLDEQGHATTAVFTDEKAPEIDTAQYQKGNGPCLEAWRTKQVVTITDMADALGTYPEFAQTAIDYGILSSMSLPIVVGDDGIGALNIYASSTHGFTADDEATATGLTTAAAFVLANAQAYWQARDMAEGLKEAMRSRAAIEQAKGMLMAQDRRLDPDGAFDLLKKASQRENVKLRDIAQRMVDRRPPPAVAANL